MEIWQLNTFRVVAKTLHFTRASEELNLTQSAVSHQIKSLENELGVELFSRNKRKITLTSQGKTVLLYADKMFNQINTMRHEIEGNSEILKGKIKVIIVTRALENPFPKIRKGFREIYKDIHLSLKTVLDTGEVLEHIREGKADIGFTVQNAVNLFSFEGLLTIPYGSFEMLFVVGKKHPLALKKNVSLNDIEKDELILFEQESWLRQITDKVFSGYDFKPAKIYETNDGAVILSMAKNCEGIALLPTWGILEELKSGNLVSVTPKNFKADIPANIVISSTRKSKLLSAFIDYLLNLKVEGFRPEGKSR